MSLSTKVLLLLGVLPIAVAPPGVSGRRLQVGKQALSGCREVIVGGGWSGIYWLYRRTEELGLAGADGLCLLEASSRLGGRTYSVNVEGTPFTLDVGAYRFSPDMHLPGDIIIKLLNLDTDCYEPSCPPAHEEFIKPFMFNYTAPLSRVVDPVTRLPSGYGTAIEMLAKRAEEWGAKIFTEAKVLDVIVASAPADGPNAAATKLIVAGPDGEALEVSSRLTLLNLPRNRLLELPSAGPSLAPEMLATLECIKFDLPPDVAPLNETEVVGSTALTKAYLYFRDAWWHTKLKKTSGATPDDGWLPVSTTKGVSFVIHWNDGPVECSESNGQCHGFLEVYYSVSNETFFSSLSTDPEEPLATISRSSGDPHEAAILDKAHAGLLEAIGPIIRAAGVAPEELVAPDQLLVGVWRRPDDNHPFGQGFTAPTKVYYSTKVSGSLSEACGVPGLTEDSYSSSVLQPWGRHVPVFLANNDYTALDVIYLFGDWAEETLLQAERGLRRVGAKRPDWLDGAYYDDKVVAKDSASQQASLADDERPLRLQLHQNKDAAEGRDDGTHPDYAILK